ncbi:hypothetical protein IGI04_006274 [Brassica rapa subsp. trilocularis]|uniref:RNase H type-1 domain-containing protein n=1 Tax=Brassica rapa subsp. trilocularis TaxID=1813537 RepID=A0ABQ7NGE1_BRACM|nr:hypothetical protein IGI04_006274 [Brassica rapa subsp. trilocularis]
MAILLAVQQLHALYYKNVMLLSDCAQLFNNLDILSQGENKRTRLNNFTFKHDPRNFVQHVDQLAKRARIMSQQYVIFWL